MDQYPQQKQQQPSPAPSGNSQPATPAPASSSTPTFQPDENCKSLYVGNLDQGVNEAMLTDIFSQAGGPVESVKIIRDKNFAHHGGPNYGFVEFADHATAENALQTLNGRRLCLQEIKVNWAFAGQAAAKEDTAAHFHIFIGDISPEVNDEMLSQAFSAFGSMSDARVMWDPNSGKSRGFGFAAYKERSDAERAITSMNGQFIGNRAVRCNWASQRGMPGPNMSHQGGNSFDMVANQTPQFNTTVYIGNLPPHTTQEDLVPYFQPFGFVVDIRLQADRGFAFVKMESHEKASAAIVRLAGTMVNGRPAKLSWGKDREAENAARNQHYGYYNGGNGGYPVVGNGNGHQNNGYHHPYQSYNNNYHQGGANNYRNQHHHHHHNNGNNNGGHHGNNNHNLQQQQQPRHDYGGRNGGLDAISGGTGSSALTAGSSAMPNVAGGANGAGGFGHQESYDGYYRNGGQQQQQSMGYNAGSR